MYNNKYVGEMVIGRRGRKEFDDYEKCSLLTTQNEFNNYYERCTDKRINHKYISNIRFEDNKMIIYLETKKPLTNIKRKGNALRKFSILLLDNGFKQYKHKHKLMKAA